MNTEARPRFVPKPAAFVAVNGGLAGIWAATGEGSYWPGGVLAPCAAFLAGHVMLRRAARNNRRRRRL